MKNKMVTFKARAVKTSRPVKKRSKPTVLRKTYTAVELMVDAIYRSAVNMDHRAAPAAEAQRRLLALAEAIDPVVLEATRQECENFQVGAARALSAFLPDSASASLRTETKPCRHKKGST